MAKVIFDREEFFIDEGTHWCAGCGYGTFARIMIDEIKRIPTEVPVIAVVEPSCFEAIAAMVPCDVVDGPHGRSVAVATGIKRSHPNATVIVFQGDGGTANEGLNELFHAAARGENITVFMGNNGVLGDTGGQLTMSGVVELPTPTSREGRKAEQHGHNLPVANLVSQVVGTAFVARMSSHDPALVYRGQRMVRRALDVQRQGLGLAFVDLVTMCPTGWGMTPIEAVKFTEQTIMPAYPPGVIKDVEADRSGEAERELAPA